MNKIILTGNITKDIELKYTKNNKEYAKFTLAVKRDMKNQLGEYETDFINCIAYGMTAQKLSEWTNKGDKIGVEGKLQVSTYEKDNKKMYSSDVVVDRIEFLQSKKTNIVNEEPKKEEKSIQSIKSDEIDYEDVLPF